ncbi:MAG: hypothetical protein FJ086_08110, partial [Deltaproteobacteria bacterium]|nr:hypothetical protein [Deltaproteobacteria bacterium]
IEGPQFSTQAESHLFRSWGASVVGMTNLPEARLAREAELCYATVAMVTDFDCWHPDHGAVTVDEVVRVLKANAGALVRAVVPRLGARPDACPHGCDRALEHAVMTAPAGRDPAVVARLDALGRGPRHLRHGGARGPAHRCHRGLRRGAGPEGGPVRRGARLCV